MRAPFLALSLLLIDTAAIAAEKAAVTFVTCPIYRDTDSGRKSGCWLADDPATQIRYDVSAAPMKAQLGKQILVEGIPSDDSDACGGVPLRPVRTSTLDATCEAVTIPPEGFAGRRFNVPADAQRPTWEVRELPPPPYVESEFYIFFDYRSDFLVYQHAEIAMEKAVLYAKASRAREVQIIGYAATDPLVASGQRFQESMALAKSRAEAVRLSLDRLGVPRSQIKVSASTKATPMVSVHAPTPISSMRRVTIRVIPGDTK